ncbi:hypothetical protein Z517_06114 [Fonsecaea pedrosoi CBS 271.37]|uniref:Amidohydrolase-related domain-containing protein n=1 Tax=Fonsecaea pedrosoi CBS 271.37 TaxID=1442368 RepID=A0A0D2EZ06_9EURO|nr:uncharacterized protein Z517_06114 [Fonsecaea pedrosoi CBS 271.37]KIW79502.1 hypothetical protein Z517_06114 [Fonsecaea pedrosoi CBS 271.37]
MGEDATQASDGGNTLMLEGRPESEYTPLLQARKLARLVCLEEHAVSPYPTPAISSTFGVFKPSYVAGLKDRLGDIALRVKIMDANHIGAQVISMNQPTAQAFVDLEEQLEWCRKSNQFVYENYCQKYPDRFFAFATLPTQSGEAAAMELERCVNEYGFVGAMINGFTNTADPTKGLYLDDPQFDKLWEVSERLQKPIFIHPRVPLASNIRVLEDMPIFHGAPYGFGRETVEHVLRLMYSGVFDRFPKLKICLGHMGEGLSWILPRTDSTFRLYNAEAQGPKRKRFQDYFQQNILPNTSGMPRTAALMNLMAESRVENIMFAVDYPYESIAEMRAWFETVPISDENWRDIGYRNAIRLFGLPLDYD